MARNVEIKARVESIEALRPLVDTLATRGPEVIEQDDTFFRCSSGRLKLRVFADGRGELIFYRRADEKGPRESFYICSPTDSPDSLREALSMAFGQTGRVRKRRTLYMAGRTRIHLDRVEALGDFIELEVVLDEEEPAEAGIREAEELMRRLGIERSRLINVSYLDLLMNRAR